MPLWSVGKYVAAVVVAAVTWTSARDYARQWIRDQVRTRLWKSLTLAVAQILLLLGTYLLVRHYEHGPRSMVAASAVLWIITVYNLLKLIRKTIPELFEVRRKMRSLHGYLLRDVLKVSLVEELLQLDLVLLSLCVVLATGARWEIQEAFQYIEPWRQLLG